MKIKANELKDGVLDWAVDKSLNLNTPYHSWGQKGKVPFYSTNWAHGGGQIIEREKIDVMWCGDRWCAYTMTPDGQSQLITEGETPLIAAMRGYVASKLGDEVEVPDDVLKDMELDDLIYDRGDE